MIPVLVLVEVIDYCSNTCSCSCFMFKTSSFVFSISSSKIYSRSCFGCLFSVLILKSTLHCQCQRKGVKSSDLAIIGITRYNKLFNYLEDSTNRAQWSIFVQTDRESLEKDKYLSQNPPYL